MNPAPVLTTRSTSTTTTRRILCVVRYPVGGIRTHLLYNYPVLSEAGYRFTFITPDETMQQPLNETFAMLPDAEFITVSGRGSACRMAPTIRRVLRSGGFAAIHSHGFTSAVEAVRGAWGFGLPHLTTIHDVVRSVQFPGWLGSIKRHLLGWVLRQVTTVIPVGEDVRENLLEYLPPLRGRAKSFAVIRNGIDASRYQRANQPERELRHELGLAPGTPLWGFLGRFMEQKGFLPMVEALALLRARHPEVDFHLVAFGSGDHSIRYQRRVQELGLEGHFTFRPFVPDIAPILQQLDLLVMPSLWEAFPLLPMEAMIAGIPVLGSDCIGLREALQDTPSRMTRAGDVESLYRGLLEAWQSPWNEAAHTFAPEAARRFDNGQAAQALLALFDRTLGGRA